MVKTLPSVYRVQAGSLVRELSSHMHCGQKINKNALWPENKQYGNKFNKDCENGSHKKKILKKVIFVLFSKYSLNYS